MRFLRYTAMINFRFSYFALLAALLLGALPIHAQQPDIIVTNVSAPASASAGGSIMVHWTTSNIGNADAAAMFFVDGIYLSRDTVFDSDTDASLTYFFHPDTLHPSQSEQDSMIAYLPADSTGQFYIMVHSDEFMAITESNENNNAGHSQALTLSNDAPDLVVTNVTAPSTGTASSMIQVAYTVHNQGNLDVTNKSWWDFIVLSQDTVYGNDDDVTIGMVTNDTSLSMGDSFTKRVNAALPSDVSGNYYVIVHLNEANQVFESNFDNNTGISNSIGIDLKLPDLIISNLQVDSKVTSGSRLHYSYTVKNTGDTTASAANWFDYSYLLIDSVYSESLLVGFVIHNQSISAGESLSVSDSISLSPTLVQGRYFLGVKTDGLGLVHESNEYASPYIPQRDEERPPTR